MKWLLYIVLIGAVLQVGAQDVTGLYKHNGFGYRTLTLKVDSTYVYSSFPRGESPKHDFGTWYKIADTVKTSTASGTIKRSFLYIRPANAVAREKGLQPRCLYYMDTLFLGMDAVVRTYLNDYAHEGLFRKLKLPRIDMVDTALHVKAGHVIYYGDTVNLLNTDGKQQGLWLGYSRQMSFTRSVWYACGGDSSTSGETEPDTTYKYTITSIGIYTNGKENGEWAYFYHDGKLKAVINYNQGTVLDKAIQLYYPGGKLKLYAKVKDDRHVAYTEYSEEGKVLKRYKGSLILLLADL